jgi:hypothetical protein
MTRIMGDATHAGVPALRSVSGLSMVAGYVTGSPDVVWTPDDWAAFPGIPHVTIDQGFTGSPVPGAVVRDCETGAWTIAQAISIPWTAARPTLYVGYPDTAAEAVRAGWRGDLWLVIPSANPPVQPSVPGCNVVAVQWNFGDPAYDLSAVYDPDWPLPAPEPPEENTLELKTGTGAVDVVRPPDYMTYLFLATDHVNLPASESTSIRVALHESAGWSVQTVMLTVDTPTVTINLPRADIYSFVRQDDYPNPVAISWR